MHDAQDCILRGWLSERFSLDWNFYAGFDLLELLGSNLSKSLVKHGVQKLPSILCRAK
jgi:hypothetical protein